MTTKTKLVNLTVALLLLGSAAARAEGGAKPGAAAAATRADIGKTLGFVPQFFLKFPEEMLPGVWEEMKTLQMNPSTALPGRTKELLGLAVSSQIPCRFCIIAHTEFAKLNGATDAEINEAVAMASFTREMSTLLNGMQIDEAQFRKDVDRLVKGATSHEKHASR
jgi:AhpD family alkylhydroperoxidase